MANATVQFTLVLTAPEMLTIAGLILGHDTDIGDAMYASITDALRAAGIDYMDRPEFIAAEKSL